jgi:hypothetical protein
MLELPESAYEELTLMIRDSVIASDAVKDVGSGNRKAGGSAAEQASNEGDRAREDGADVGAVWCLSPATEGADEGGQAVPPAGNQDMLVEAEIVMLKRLLAALQTENERDVEALRSTESRHPLGHDYATIPSESHLDRFVAIQYHPGNRTGLSTWLEVYMTGAPVRQC